MQMYWRRTALWVKAFGRSRCLLIPSSILPAGARFGPTPAAFLASGSKMARPPGYTGFAGNTGGTNVGQLARVAEPGAVVTRRSSLGHGVAPSEGDSRSVMLAGAALLPGQG